MMPRRSVRICLSVQDTVGTACNFCAPTAVYLAGECMTRHRAAAIMIPFAVFTHEDKSQSIAIPFLLTQTN
jgi:hypothetical protein